MHKQDHPQSLLFFLAIIVFAGLVLILGLKRFGSGIERFAPKDSDPVQSLASAISALEETERRMNETVWAKEILAQKCGAVFEALWDRVNAASNRWEVLAAFPFGGLLPPVFGEPEALGEGVLAYKLDHNNAQLTPAGWRQLLGRFAFQGWKLRQMEIRHNRFETDPNGNPKQSIFYLAAHLDNPSRSATGVLDGDLRVQWRVVRDERDGSVKDPDSDQSVAGRVEADRANPIYPDSTSELTGEGIWRLDIAEIDASGLRLITRTGKPVFEQILHEEIVPVDGSYFIDPLIVYDLDGDGISEVILAAKNLVFRRQTSGGYQKTTLCRHAPGLIFTGLIADFNRDGSADFLCAKFEGLFLFRGTPNGEFNEQDEQVWAAEPHLKYAQVLACGDIDGDGDLDVWLGQYKVPYQGGQMPAPYYNANDGHPSYLLVNDGHGVFTDRTKESNLEKWRWRRCYSGSFTDLDEDGDLDLAVVSDFAGVDFYRNNGAGYFEDVTSDWIENNRAFGMAHSIADFDGDGRLDFLMIGMNSPAADRLNGMALNRPGLIDNVAERAAMVFGNRLFLRRGSARMFEQTALNSFIQRSGWSWGCAAFDWDNDGFQDLYIGNGHESKESVRDYETEFWLHDIYVGNSKKNPVAEAYFAGRYARTRGRGLSYGGYEKNRLYWNRQGASFVEVGHLMGVALEQDSRNVVADDVDGDGRADLLVTTFEAWPRIKQTLQIFRNAHESNANWIGFRLREQGAGISPVGARIRLEYEGRIQVRENVTGESFRSQHSNTVLFGLGTNDVVKRVEVRWTSGKSMVMAAPEVNRYHSVTIPK